MKIPAVNRICKNLSAQYGIVKPPVVVPMPYSRTGKCVMLGYYDDTNNIIQINKYALDYWSQKQIIELIQHELIHTRCYQDFGHGGHGKRFCILSELMGISKRVRKAIKIGE
jgi:predicted SprT family Zn-dependent metalloprotease